MNTSKRHRLATTTLLTLLSLAAALPAAADRPSPRPLGHERVSTSAFADVLRVVPIYRQLSVREPVEECWIENQQRYIEPPRPNPGRGHRTQSGGGSDALAGALIGGIIGNQLGRNGSSHGRAGATVAGALIGGALVNEARAEGGTARHRSPARANVQERRVVSYPVEQCRQTVAIRHERVIDGYEVTYRYHGQLYTTTMDHDPGERIRVEVNVRPVHEYRPQSTQKPRPLGR